MAERRRPAAGPVAGPVALLVALALLLAACGGTSSGQGGAAGSRLVAGQVLDPPFTVAPISLTDTAGQPFELATDGGGDADLVLAFFGYTNCPDVCGLVMGNLASAMTRLSEADRARVQVVFVTTDPARDDAATLRRYLDRLDPDFEGLTGDLDQIAALGKSVAVGVTDGQKLPSGGYDLNTHSTQVTGIVPGGTAPVYWRQTTSAAQYAADIHTILTDGAPA